MGIILTNYNNNKVQIRIVELYKCYFQNNSLVDFISMKNVDFDTFWFLKNRPAYIFFSKLEIMIQELECFLEGIIKIKGFRNKKIICFGGQYALLLITRLIGRLLGHNYHLFIYNFYLHELGEKRIIKRILHFLLNSDYTTLIVQSPNELTYYKPLSKNSIFFIPYCEDPEFELNSTINICSNYLFAGGYTNRDYDLILRCAQLNLDKQFVLVISKLNKDINDSKLPDNVKIFEEVDGLTFNSLMYNSFGVIIPLKKDIGASGQSLCLGALKMSKPVIYCNISSVNFYFKDSNSDYGIPYTIGDIDSLNDAIQKLYSDKFDFKTFGKNAYVHFTEKFTLNKRNETLFDVILKENFAKENN